MLARFPGKVTGLGYGRASEELGRADRARPMWGLNPTGGEGESLPNGE